MAYGIRERSMVESVYKSVPPSPIPVGGIPPEGAWKIGVNFFAKKKVLEMFFLDTDIESDFDSCPGRPGILKFVGDLSIIGKYDYLLGEVH